MDARNILSVAGVLLVLGGVGYYWGLGRPQPLRTATEETRRPDYEAGNILFMESGKDGKLSRRLEAPSLRHFSSPDDQTEIDNPVMRLYADGREAWKLQAARGVSLQGSKEIRLDGGVIAERRDPEAVPLRFTTPSLTSWPDEERLQSNSGIHLVSPQGEISGQTLQASLRTSTVEINQNVTGTYAPARH